MAGTLHLVPEELRTLYSVHEWRNAAGVLQTACPSEWADIIPVLGEFGFYKSDVMAGGGGRAPISKRLDGGFYARKWVEKQFRTAIVLDDVQVDSPTHK